MSEEKLDGFPLLYKNDYLGYALVEIPCRICGGDLGIYCHGKSLVRFCNFDLRELLPAMTEFVKRKDEEDEIE